MKNLIFLFCFLFSLNSLATTHHRLNVELIPSLKMIRAQDQMLFPEGSPRQVHFLLHKDLQVQVLSANDDLVLLNPAPKNSHYAEYGLTLGADDDQVILSYQGVIFDPVVGDQSSGLISSQGATLFGSSYWYPFVPESLTTFDVTVKTPIHWKPFVQGQQITEFRDASSNNARFAEIYPQEEIYLIAGPFEITGMEWQGRQVQILLRQKDPALAQSFLSLLPGYLQHYSELIAGYPYAAFSVVENFWETGYGMPSFTLLGPTVIRLPFILHSSLPHEVLHNWWGNSVYVDYNGGNWSEGLTTYMADYWQQELSGQGREYRLNTLIGFSDYVSQGAGQDFPLRQFRGRHNSSSQAVGYGKSMMFFHMLEKHVGAESFKKSLQTFYNDNLFKRAAFADIQKSFEKVTTSDLSGFFTQWLDHKGAVGLELSKVKIMRWSEDSFNTTYALTQTGDVLYDLDIPVTWTLESGQKIERRVRLSEKTQVFHFLSPQRPVQINVDGDYNVFRQLYPEERPVTLSAILGSKNVHFYFDGHDQGAQQFVARWRNSIQGKSHLHSLTDEFTPSAEGALVLVGNHEVFRRFMAEQLAKQDMTLSATSLTVGTESFSLLNSSVVLTAHRKNKPTQSIVWVHWDQNNNPAEWAGRLTHYGKYGILVFKDRPVIYRGTWPVLESPLKRGL